MKVGENMKSRVLILVGMVLLAGVLVAGCSRASQENATNSKAVPAAPVNVFVSILPQADFVQKIGGEKVRVAVMIPPGANPASYEPSPAQLKDLAHADLYLQVGNLPFEEAWMERIKSTNSNMLVVDTSQSITIVDDNPHTWLSPRLVKIQAQNIYEALVEVDPQNRSQYQEGYRSFVQQLDGLDEEIASTLAGVKGKTFIVFHPAWGYLASDYGLKELAIEHEGKEPGARELSAIVAQAHAAGIKNIFASPQHSTHSADALARELGGKVMLIDPLPRDYIKTMQENAQVLAQGISD